MQFMNFRLDALVKVCQIMILSIYHKNLLVNNQISETKKECIYMIM